MLTQLMKYGHRDSADAWQHAEGTDGSGGMVPKAHIMKELTVTGIHMLLDDGVRTEDVISIWNEWIAI